MPGDTMSRQTPRPSALRSICGAIAAFADPDAAPPSDEAALQAARALCARAVRRMTRSAMKICARYATQNQCAMYGRAMCAACRCADAHAGKRCARAAMRGAARCAASALCYSTNYSMTPFIHVSFANAMFAASSNRIVQFHRDERERSSLRRHGSGFRFFDARRFTPVMRAVLMPAPKHTPRLVSNARRLPDFLAALLLPWLPARPSSADAAIPALRLSDRC